VTVTRATATCNMPIIFCKFVLSKLKLATIENFGLGPLAPPRNRHNGLR
jgi:hypothetical protein